jgi:hypothetical protein
MDGKNTKPQHLLGFEWVFRMSQKKLLAESGGFEPPVQLSPYNGLANRRLQPLGQLSSGVAEWNDFIIAERRFLPATKLVRLAATNSSVARKPQKSRP